MRRRIINECKQQFPDCPEEVDHSCKACPFYKDALKKQKSVIITEDTETQDEQAQSSSSASTSSESEKSEISENQAQPLNINP